MATDDAPDALEDEENRSPEIKPEEWEGSEQRRHPRYACDGYAEVHLPHAGLRFRGHIQNLSISGCYIETELNLERGTYVEVFFRVRQLRFRLAGNIAGVEWRKGVRIAFREVSSRGAAYVEELVRELAGAQEDNLQSR